MVVQELQIGNRFSRERKDMALIIRMSEIMKTVPPVRRDMAFTSASNEWPIA